MNEQHQLQAILFDLDGVITDTAEQHFLAWQALAEELQIPFTREDNEQLKGISRMDSLQHILTLSEEKQSYSAEQLEALAEKKNKLYQTYIAQLTPDDLLPGIAQFIDACKQHNMKTAIASASKNAFTVIERLQLSTKFDVIVDAAKIERSKPDPEVFLKAAELLQVEPRYCIGIEDAYAGVEAINAAGMYAVAIGNAENFPHADLVLTSTSELTWEGIIEAYIS